MSETETETVEDVQADVDSNLARAVTEMQESLDCAESCETQEDLIANLAAMIAYAETVRREARALLKRAKKAAA